MTDAKRVLVIGELDGYANGIKPVEVQRFLSERGHEVRLLDAYHLSRAPSRSGSGHRKLPSLWPSRLALYALEAATGLLIRRSRLLRSCFSYHTLVADLRLRRRILRSSLPLDDFDLIICEHPHDSLLMTVATSARKLYDCPTPWADEMFAEGRLTPRQHRKLRRLEREIFEAADHLAFHWETYGGYAREHYGISGGNLLKLNFGCRPAARRAEFQDPPRVVYLGSMSSRFIDLPLLSRLHELYPSIDVYGGPPPDPDLGLNYLGYAPPSILSEYQLGLVTCTKDELRREGFSAKHLQYLAHGLPVLVPAWRRHLDLLRGSVPYDEQSFPAVIEALRDEEAWRRLSDEAYAQAQRLDWEETLRPLESLLAAPSEAPLVGRR